MSGKGIPFVDLVAPHIELEDDLVDAFRNVLTTGMFVGGPMVEQFEKDFADFSGTNYCIGVGSGTDALRFVLIAAGVGNGDLVITVANTFAATVEAILQAGATPYFVDIDPTTYNLSVSTLRSFLTDECDRLQDGKVRHKTSGKIVAAIMPVHLYGQPCDMDEIMAVASEYSLMVFEDACQAHGSEYLSSKGRTWQKAGSIGRAAAFSFYPGKNLGACGEGGAVTTNDEGIAQRVRMIRDHGQSRKYQHQVEGYNGRLDALQAALLRVKLPYLEGWNQRRRELAANYDRLLRGVDGIEVPVAPAWVRPIYHLYVIKCRQNREDLQRFLTENSIATGLHYPIPLHQQPAYRRFAPVHQSLPITEQLASSILSLPIYPQLRADQQEQVAETVSRFFQTQTVTSAL